MNTRHTPGGKRRHQTRAWTRPNPAVRTPTTTSTSFVTSSAMTSSSTVSSTTTRNGGTTTLATSSAYHPQNAWMSMLAWEETEGRIVDQNAHDQAYEAYQAERDRLATIPNWQDVLGDDDAIDVEPRPELEPPTSEHTGAADPTARSTSTPTSAPDVRPVARYGDLPGPMTRARQAAADATRRILQALRPRSTDRWTQGQPPPPEAQPPGPSRQP
jgi:hypothetical protein